LNNAVLSLLFGFGFSLYERKTETKWKKEYHAAAGKPAFGSVTVAFV